MDIGTEERPYVLEPIVEPVPARAPVRVEPAPDRQEEPVAVPEEVGV